MAHVQQAEGAAAGAAGSIATGQITTTLGNRLVAFVTYFRAAQTTITLTDSQGNTWTPVGSQQYNATDDGGWQMFSAIVQNAGATVFTATFGNNDAEFRGIAVIEDDEGTGALDGSSYNRAGTGLTGTDAINAGVATNASQPARHFAFAYNFFGTAAPPAGTGYTGRAVVWGGFGGGAGTCARWEDRDLAATGNQSATFSPTASAVYFMGQAIFLNDAGGAPGFNPATVRRKVNVRRYA